MPRVAEATVASSVRRLRSEMGKYVLMPPGAGRLAGKVFREPDGHVPLTQCEREMVRIASRDLTTAI
jgi:hypothetical protein